MFQLCNMLKQSKADSPEVHVSGSIVIWEYVRQVRLANSKQ